MLGGETSLTGTTRISSELPFFGLIERTNFDTVLNHRAKTPIGFSSHRVERFGYLGSLN